MLCGPLVLALQKEARTRGVQPYVDQLIIQTQKQACYSAENVGHFGLGFDRYTHFTSPIRRYSDHPLHVSDTPLLRPDAPPPSQSDPFGRREKEGVSPAQHRTAHDQNQRARAGSDTGRVGFHGTQIRPMGRRTQRDNPARRRHRSGTDPRSHDGPGYPGHAHLLRQERPAALRPHRGEDQHRPSGTGENFRHRRKHPAH
ncbi:MAG: hypothetical protein B6D59_08655 [Campylobacteraceae bacterium 4484_4]|nr:MAG: hypothetical protein B6D59_08655 [Campylobacteraceae bacterium 4484_4]